MDIDIFVWGGSACAYVKYLLPIEKEIKRMGLFGFDVLQNAADVVCKMLLEIWSRSSPDSLIQVELA